MGLALQQIVVHRRANADTQLSRAQGVIPRFPQPAEVAQLCGHIEVNRLKPSAVVFELLHASYHEGVHAAELDTPLLKSSDADAQFPENLDFFT